MKAGLRASWGGAHMRFAAGPWEAQRGPAGPACTAESAGRLACPAGALQESDKPGLARPAVPDEQSATGSQLRIEELV